MSVRVGRMAGSLAEDLGLSALVWLNCVFSQYNCQFAVCGWLGRCLGGTLSVPDVDLMAVAFYLLKLTGYVKQ